MYIFLIYQCERRRRDYNPFRKLINYFRLKKTEILTIVENIENIFQPVPVHSHHMQRMKLKRFSI